MTRSRVLGRVQRGPAGRWLPVALALAGCLVTLTSTASTAQATSTAATAAITLSPAIGPPTTKVAVHGSGFGSSETVVVRFDAGRVATATTSAAGAFATSFNVPRPAPPGRHLVTAKGQVSGRSATATFSVRTDWPQFRFGPDHLGTNPYENVLGPANVAGLSLDWSVTTGAAIFSSPAVANGVVYVGSEDDNLYALNAATGKKLWSFTTGAEF